MTEGPQIPTAPLILASDHDRAQDFSQSPFLPYGTGTALPI